MRQISREQRLGDLIGDWGVDGLKAHIAARIKDGESFNRICESWLIPYRLTAEITGWRYKEKKFGEPYERFVPKLPVCPVLQFPQIKTETKAKPPHPAGDDGKGNWI